MAPAILCNFNNLIIDIKENMCKSVQSHILQTVVC